MTKKHLALPVAVTAIKKVLPYLKSYIVKNGYAPTNRELATHFKYKTAWMANLILQELEKQGHIKLLRNKKGRARTRLIKIIK